MSTTVTYKGSTLTTATNQTRTLKTAGKYMEGDVTVVDVTAPSPTMQAKTNINPTTSSQTITPDDGYDGLSSVQINAMPSGSATPAASISATGASVTAGTNTLTLSKTVSNTPQVSAGYVSSGTAGNSAVSLTASVNTRSNSDLTASGATVTAPAGYYESAASKSVVSGTEGTPTASKGTVSNHAISVTPSVTNSAGYISGGTHTGTAVSVSASELVSGTFYVTSSGTKDVTDFASVSIPALSLPDAESSPTSGFTQRANFLRSSTDRYINLPTGFNSAGQYYKINAVPDGTEGTPTATKGTVSNHQVSITPSVTNTAGYISGGTKTGTAVTVTASELASGNKEITANGTNIDVVGYSTVSVDVQGGGGSGAKIGTATATPSSASASISFTGLQGEPTSFAIVSAADLATGASPYKSSAVVFDGQSIHGQYITNTSNAQMTASDSAFTKSYSNGTLTVTGTGTNWQANQYKLMYSYDGSSSNIGTDDVQVGSGATSITFTDLPDEPTAWSCIFKSNIGTSSGYTRALVVVNDGTSIYGMEMGSAAQAEANWSASYSNGSLTISSQSTSAGGYFHQPGYYQLTYVIGGEISVDIEPLSVTQNGTYSESGKAYSPVVVNVPSSGGASIGTETMTNSSNQAQSIDFTLPSGRTPKAFFARLTSQITRNSNSRYYYVENMRWDGSTTGGVAGRCFYMSSGQLTNITSGYSYSQSGTTFTLSSTGTRSASPGSFYNGTYEMVYVY